MKSKIAETKKKGKVDKDLISKKFHVHRLSSSLAKDHLTRNSLSRVTFISYRNKKEKGKLLTQTSEPRVNAYLFLVYLLNKKRSFDNNNNIIPSLFVHS